MKKFFREHGIWVLFATAVIAVSLSLMSFFSNTSSPLSNLAGIIASPFRSAYTAVTGWITDKQNYYQDVTALEEENAALRRENAILKAQNRLAQTNNEENARLRDLLNLRPQNYDLELETASVTERTVTNWTSSLTLNIGTDHGVEVNDCVIDETYALVGVVSEVGLNWCTVLTIVDTDTSLGAQVFRTKDLGLAVGDFSLMRENRLRLDYLPADAMATGHYARVRLDTPSGRWQLLRGADRRKDQTYFLYQLTQHQLAHLLLPVGDYEKPALRALAAANGLSNAQKADSQDICFVPDGDYVSFLRQYGGVEPVPGDFLDSEGRVLGRHRGMECYTIGQRKGLGVSANAPLYVLGKDPDRNAVILGEDNRLYTRELTAERVNWLSVPEPDRPLSVTAKTRYSQREAAATVEPLPGGRIRMVFTEPQRAVTPGQAVVFYDGDLVLGGGTICP